MPCKGTDQTCEKCGLSGVIATFFIACLIENKGGNSEK
jgi:hypothetical protein